MTVVLNRKMFTIEEVFEKIDFKEKEFYWAYLYGLFYFEQIRFEQLKFTNFLEMVHLANLNNTEAETFLLTINRQVKNSNLHDIFPDYEDFSYFVITKNDAVIDLYNTEAFYLITLLRNASVTKTDFIPTYKLKESVDARNGIETDGRYFRFFVSGEKITLDIGFNFIKENELDKSLRGK